MEDSGLIVIAGPAASGKTTTVAALLDHVNATRARHIVTLEDPIEVLSDKQSLVSQVARVDPGSFFVVTFSSGGPDPGASNEWIRGVDSEWEAWDGESWTATHVLLDGAYVDEEPTTHALDGDGTYAIGDIALPADGDVRFLAPPPTEAPPGWHRVCTGVYGDTDGADPPAVRPCVQVRVVGSVPADVPQTTTHDGTTTTHQAFAETTMPSTPGSDVRPGG